MILYDSHGDTLVYKNLLEILESVDGILQWKFDM